VSSFTVRAQGRLGELKRASPSAGFKLTPCQLEASLRELLLEM
jgi:hypothetical protein